jgi:hypothetical protein
VRISHGQLIFNLSTFPKMNADLQIRMNQKSRNALLASVRQPPLPLDLNP